LKEGAVPYPSNDGNYKIFKLSDLAVDRRMPAVTTAHYVPHGSSFHQNLLSNIYNYEDFVSLENDDTVVEVGAYIGTWTEIAAEVAERVIAIDPLARVDNSLQYNIHEHDNVRIVDKAAWSENKEVQINTSHNPNENSILSPDDFATGVSITLPGDTVPNIARENGIEKIDYLKIEAEGAEPEILTGALTDDMEITKIAIDAGPERGEENVSEEVISILEKHDYHWKMKQEEIAWGENIVFARKNI
jgi:FkbM family methyltransferase